MYDQFGFYSENGFPGAGPGRAAAGRRSEHGFRRLRFLRISAQQRGPERRAGASAERQAGGGFRDIFSQFFGGGERPAGEAAAGEGRRSRVRAEHRFLAGHPRHAGHARTSPARKSARPATAPASAGGNSRPVPQCNGTGNVTQMAGAMKFNLTCPRCDGTGRLKNACPTCHGDGRMAASGNGGSPDPAGRAERLASARRRARATRARWARPPGDLYITIRVEDASVLPARRRRYRDQGAGHALTKPGWARRSKCPTIDGRALLKIPQGTQNGQKFRLREKGVFNARKNKRGDQIVEVVHSGARRAATSARENCCANWRKLHPEDPRAGNLDEGVG